MKKYLLDANVFIQAKRFYYPFDIFPGFWEWLDREMENGVLGSIIPIYDELTAGSDILSQWAIERKDSGWFLPVEEVETQEQYSVIASWAVNPAQKFKQTAQEEFLFVGDSWLIAKAVAENRIIVTHEKYDANSQKRILIPNVCRAFGIEYIDTVELIRRTGARFGLQ